MMSNYKKHCKCSISSISEPNISHCFCKDCGRIFLKDEINKSIYYTIKSKYKKETCEMNPIEIIKKMKENTEKFFPNLNNEYNKNNIESNNIDDLYKSINLYNKLRKMIVKTIQKLIIIHDFEDSVFYQCLFYLDSFISHIITEETTEEDILYYLVGFFLCSCKFKQTDILEPSLESLCILKKNIFLKTEKILEYEIICLKKIGYNPFGYSIYEWLNELISNGIILNCEIDENNIIILINGHRHSIINAINKYAFRIMLSITINNIFFKYSPMYMAFAIIQIARENYLDKNLINNSLYFQLINLYGVNFNDYKKCYFDLKNELKEIKKEKESNIINNEDEKFSTIKFKTLSVDKSPNSNNPKSKLNSNINLINLKTIYSSYKEIKINTLEEEKINKILDYKIKDNSNKDNETKEDSQKKVNNLNMKKTYTNNLNDNILNKKDINIIKNDNNLNNINMIFIKQEEKNKNVSTKIEINCYLDKQNYNTAINRKKIKSKTHVIISSENNNNRNNKKYKTTKLKPISKCSNIIKAEQENILKYDKDLITETNPFNNKVLKQTNNFHSSSKNNLKLSEDRKQQRKTKYIITNNSNNSNNNQLFDKHKYINLKQIYRKDVSSFKSIDFFNNDSNYRRFFKSSDKFINTMNIFKK